MRNPYRNAAEKADIGASRSKLNRGYDRVPDFADFIFCDNVEVPYSGTRLR